MSGRRLQTYTWCPPPRAWIAAYRAEPRSARRGIAALRWLGARAALRFLLTRGSNDRITTTPTALVARRIRATSRGAGLRFHNKIRSAAE